MADKDLAKVIVLLDELKEAVEDFKKIVKDTLPAKQQARVDQIGINIDLIKKAIRKKQWVFISGNVEQIGKAIDQVSYTPFTPDVVKKWEKMEVIHSKLVKEINRLDLY